MTDAYVKKKNATIKFSSPRYTQTFLLVKLLCAQKQEIGKLYEMCSFKEAREMLRLNHDVIDMRRSTQTSISPALCLRGEARAFNIFKIPAPLGQNTVQISYLIVGLFLSNAYSKKHGVDIWMGDHLD